MTNTDLHFPAIDRTKVRHSPKDDNCHAYSTVKISDREGNEVCIFFANKEEVETFAKQVLALNNQ